MTSESRNLEFDFVSLVVCLSFVEGANLEGVLLEFQSVLEGVSEDYEIIIVADKVDAINRKQIEALLTSINSIRFIESIGDLSESESFEFGFRLAIGDYVLYLRPDQDESSLIPEILKVAKETGKVVVGVDGNPRETVAYRILRPSLRLIERPLDYHLPRRATSIRCFSRRQLNSYFGMVNSSDQAFFKVHQISEGYHAFSYKTKGSHRKALLPKLFEVASLTVNNSTKPLRFASLLGVFGSFAAFIFACYSFLSHFMTTNIVSGWSSLVVIVSFLFFVLFLILVLVGEYLGRIIRDLNAKDRLSGLKESHSKIMTVEDRLNVLDFKAHGEDD